MKKAVLTILTLSVVCLCVACGGVHEFSVNADILDIYDAGSKAWLRGRYFGSPDGNFSETNNVICLKWEWPDGELALADYPISGAQIIYFDGTSTVRLRVKRNAGYTPASWHVFIPGSDVPVARIYDYSHGFPVSGEGR